MLTQIYVASLKELNSEVGYYQSLQKQFTSGVIKQKLTFGTNQMCLMSVMMKTK